MADRINITSGDELEAWLKANAGDQLGEWSRIIALRAALRVWPLVFTVLDGDFVSETKSVLILQSWRMTLISSLAGTWPSDKMIGAARRTVFNSIVHDQAFNGAVGKYAVYATRAAALASYSVGRANAAYAARTTIEAADAAASAAATARAAGAAYAALSCDCAVLQRRGIDKLLTEPPWLALDDVGEVLIRRDPESLPRILDYAESAIELYGSKAMLFIAWYEPLLAGNPSAAWKETFMGERARDLALKPNKFWEIADNRPASMIMDEIAEALGWEPETADLGDDGADDLPIEIIPQEPATLEPEWRDGQLALPTVALRNDFDEGDMAEALKALKQILDNLADSASKAGNIDRRWVDYLQQLSEAVPVVVPDQADFFVLAHNETVLAGLVPTAEREWDVLLASKLAAASLQFADTVKKFPTWRAFRKSVPDDDMSVDDVSEAQDLAHVLADALRDKLAAEFIEPAIPNRLDGIADDILVVDPVQADERAVPFSIREKTHDVLESINNILKPIMAGALWAKGQAGQLGEATWDRLSKGIRTEYGAQVEKLGSQIVKAGFFVLKYCAPVGVGALAGGKPLVGWLLTSFPTYFKWLEPIAKLLGLVI